MSSGDRADARELTHAGGGRSQPAIHLRGR